MAIAVRTRVRLADSDHSRVSRPLLWSERSNRPEADVLVERSDWVAAKKSRTTFSKVARERERKERRELKQEKKRAARMAKQLGLAAPQPPEGG
jgi:hypothetical protein